MDAGARGHLQENEGSQIWADESARAIAELQAKLRVTEIELERAKIQRDYFLRLLQQQQALRTSIIQNYAFAFRMEQRKSMMERLFNRIPRDLKDLFPVRLKQVIKNIAIKIG